LIVAALYFTVATIGYDYRPSLVESQPTPKLTLCSYLILPSRLRLHWAHTQYVYTVSGRTVK